MVVVPATEGSTALSVNVTWAVTACVPLVTRDSVEGSPKAYTIAIANLVTEVCGSTDLVDVRRSVVGPSLGIVETRSPASSIAEPAHAAIPLALPHALARLVREWICVAIYLINRWDAAQARAVSETSLERAMPGCLVANRLGGTHRRSPVLP